MLQYLKPAVKQVVQVPHNVKSKYSFFISEPILAQPFVLFDSQKNQKFFLETEKRRIENCLESLNQKRKTTDVQNEQMVDDVMTKIL
jgi:hypothetical protein